MSAHELLVVDDEGTVRHVLRQILEKHGCMVRCAGSAEEALEVLDGWSPHVAILDIILPGMSGLELLSRVKVRSPDTEILIITSNPSAETALEAMEKGAHDYVKKPFDLREAWIVVQRTLEKRLLALKNREVLKKQEQLTQELTSRISIDGDENGKSSPDAWTPILEDFLDVVTRDLSADRASVMLMAESDRELKIVAQRGMSSNEIERGSVIVGQGLAGTAAETGEPILVTGKKIGEMPPGTDRHPLHEYLYHSDSFLVVPIVQYDPGQTIRKVHGVINVTDRRTGIPFDRKDLSYLKSLASQLAVALERVRQSNQLQKAYETLKSTQDQLVFSERLNAVGQMASGIAHDFKNALSIIMARAQFARIKIQETPADIEGIEEHIDLIIRTASLGAEAISRLQNFTKVRRGSGDAPLDINDVIRSAIEIARPKWKDATEAEGRRIEAQLELEEVPNVNGNAYELTQVVGNLIFNAVEAMPEGGRLVFRSRHENDCVILEVEDDGIGMNEDTQKRLFNPFFTTKESGQGLGTSIIKGIVSRHMGGISVTSRLGEGSKFTVRLPAFHESAQASHAGRDAAPADEGPVRVLLVDDDQGVLEIYRETLLTKGHEVVAVGSTSEALSQLGSGEFGVMITDKNLKGMNGLELALEARSKSPGLPVVLLSGESIHIDDEEVRQAGISHVLSKPCRIEDLLGAVHRYARKQETAVAQGA